MHSTSIRSTRSISLFAMLWFLGAPTVLWAQFKEPDANATKLGASTVQRWQIGVIVKAVGGPCKGIVAYCPMPIDWPEQQVKIVKEDVSPTARISYKTINETVKLMEINIANLAAEQESRALVTLEIDRRGQLPPEKTDRFVVPDLKKIERKMQLYLGPSPLIETRQPKIKKAAKRFAETESQQKAWEKVEAIYDWVRTNVEYKNGPIKGALAALNDKTGDCEELTSLFIALCRINNIPARTVWVPGHCYPEFYLVDEKGEGHWFPCQAAGAREFGGIKETRPILQKGDNFRPPWNRRDHKRYLAEHLTGAGGRPKVQWVRKTVGQ